MNPNCPECGVELTDDTCELCPRCGKRLPTYTLNAQTGRFEFDGNPVSFTVTRHWEHLLATANQLDQDEHHGSAVVIAQAACEVVVARAMSKAYEEKGVPELEEAVEGYLNAKSLTNSNTQRLYKALTGDADINQQAFWSGYTAMVKLRHGVAHAGRKLTAPESRRSIDAARAFVAHVEQHNGLA